jgi:PAS domain S-box-containing protein
LIGIKKEFSSLMRRVWDSARQPHTGALLAGVAVLMILLPLWWQAGHWYQAQLIREQKANAAVDVSLRGDALSLAITRRLARLQGLQAFVAAQLGTGDPLTVGDDWPQFDTFAAALYAGSKGVRNLAVAPEGIVRYVYPVEGNEMVLGYEPLQDPRSEVREDVERALGSGRVILSGPLQLVQGGLGLIVRQAIYDERQFWGLINMVLDIAPLLDESDITTNTGGLELALRDSRGRVFFGTSGLFEQDPVIKHVSLPEGAWELVGIPSEGWSVAVQRPLRVFQMGGLVILGLLAGLAYLSVNRQARLAQVVQQRTRELQNDVVQRKRAEAALREREAQYRGVFESTSDGLLINDLSGRLVDFNPAAAHMHGYEPQEFRELQPAQFIHPNALSHFEAYIDAVRIGQEFRGQTLNLRRDGTPFPVEILGTGFTYLGRPHALAVLRDITQQVAVLQVLEDRVAQRTRELATLLELSNELAATLEMQPLVGRMLERLQQVVDFDAATVWMVEASALQAVGYRGQASADAMTGARLPLDRVEMFWQALGQRSPLLIEDVQRDMPLARAYRELMQEVSAATSDGVRAWMGIPLVAQERIIGVLTIGSRQPAAYTPRHAALALAIANQAAIALENARLYGQARRLAVLEERQRLARELHDSVSQALYGIGLGARTARAQLERDPAKAIGPLEYVLSLADAGLAEMRALIFELRPDSLEREGLVAALAKQAAALHARHQMEVTTAFCDEPDLAFEAKEALYRIAQEALNNIVKHARAGHVELRLEDCGAQIVLGVQDDGVGFDPEGRYPGHFGLHSMQERAVRLGGRLEIESGVGLGTLVRAVIRTPAEKQPEDVAPVRLAARDQTFDPVDPASSTSR